MQADIKTISELVAYYNKLKNLHPELFFPILLEDVFDESLTSWLVSIGENNISAKIVKLREICDSFSETKLVDEYLGILSPCVNNPNNSISDDEAYNKAKGELDEIEALIHEAPYFSHDPLDGIRRLEREKEGLYEMNIRPLAYKWHKLASIDYYWYLFVRHPEDAEEFLNKYEKEHPGDKLIDRKLSDDEMYAKAIEMLEIIADCKSRCLSQTQYSGLHSSDINETANKQNKYVIEKFILPLAKKGHRPSCLEYYQFLRSCNRCSDALIFRKEYDKNHPNDKLIDDTEAKVNQYEDVLSDVISKGPLTTGSDFLLAKLKLFNKH